MNMFNILTKLASIAGTENTKALKEWGGDPAELDAPKALPDSDPDEANAQHEEVWNDMVRDLVKKHDIKIPSNDEAIYSLAGKIEKHLAKGDYSSPDIEFIADVLTKIGQSHQTSSDAFQSIMGGSASDLTGNLKIREAADQEKTINTSQGEIVLVQREYDLDNTPEHRTQIYAPDGMSAEEVSQAIGAEVHPSDDEDGDYQYVAMLPKFGEEQESDHDLTMESLRVLSGLNNALNECGIPTASVGGSRPPASINITAASGSELTGMLKDIMNLAGVKSAEAPHKPIDVLANPAEVDHIPGAPSMAALIRAVDEPAADTDSMNDKPENEEFLGTLAGGALGAMVGGPLGALTGAAAGDSLTDPDADEVEKEGMPEKTANRPWDSSPHEKERQDGVRKFGDLNSGDHRERQAGLARAKPTQESIAASLFAEYEKFMAETTLSEGKKPSAGLTKAEKSSVVKKAKAGKDIGKPGKGFAKVEKAAKAGGAKDPKAVAAAAMWKQQASKKK